MFVILINFLFILFLYIKNDKEEYKEIDNIYTYI